MKKFVSICLLLCLLCGMFAGCSAPKSANSTTDIEIVYWESGYGRAFMDALVKAFNESQTTYKATLVSSAENRTSEIYLNSDKNTVDLYFNSFNTCNAYTEYLEPLDELLAYKPDGETGLTIGEKMGQFDDINKAEDGHNYALLWTPFSLTGLLYNKNLFVDQNGNPYDMPNTTDELIDLSVTIFSDGKTPFIHYKDYWYYVYEAWIAQYEGVEVYNDIWNGIYTDENGTKHENNVGIVAESKGRYEAYSVLSDLLAPKGYVYTNSNSFNHTTAQTYFINDKAVMMPNGSWIQAELNDPAKAEKIGIMKTPVLSALGTKLGIKSDKHLSFIVDYVDGEELSADKLEIVNSYSEEIIEAVREARGIHYVGHPAHVIIPKYSNCKAGAKEFLKFYYSDKGMEITQNILKMPLALTYSVQPNIDKSSWSTFMRESDEILEEGTILSNYLNRRIFYVGGIQHLSINNPVEHLIYRQDGAVLSVDQYWAMETEKWKNEWPRYLTNAGLN